MTDIPEDILRAAQAVFLNNLGRGMVQNIEAISSAIKAERERCAGVAEAHAAQVNARMEAISEAEEEKDRSFALVASTASALVMAEKIAAEIRKGDQ